MIVPIAVIVGVIVFMFLRARCPKGGFHDWEYKGEYGWTYQRKQCSKCHKLKIEDQ